MQKKIVIALEDPSVATWFSVALNLYGRNKGVKIFLLLMHKKVRRPTWVEEVFFGKFFKIFKQKNITADFEHLEHASDGPLLGFVSSRSQDFLTGAIGRRSCFFVVKGSLFTASGFRGFWHYIIQFFSLERPMVIEDVEKQCFYHAWFQTRAFRFTRNNGYLRFNIEKVLDHLIFQTPLGYPVSRQKFPQENLLKKFVAYPFWEFYYKMREKFFKPRWHLIQTTVCALQNNKRLKGKCLDFGNEGGWADPFLVVHNDQIYLFAEHIVKGIGQLAFFRYNAEKHKIEGRPVTIMNTGKHLSYPFVFQVKGEWYMMPESSAAGELVIYKAANFPNGWERFRVVFQNGEWLDTTPFFHHGKWWIFSIYKPVSYASTYQELHLFYCNDILHDRWISHPRNPVVSDSRCARPGGPLFLRDGKLFRPGQNCSRTYGGRISLCEVLKLSETKYEEQQFAEEIYFPWYSRKTSFHTLSVLENIVMGDCKF
jgi:hypothetical protein